LGQLCRGMTAGPFPKPYADFVARLRVPSGFLLAAAFAWFAEPSVRSLVYGLPISIAGLALRAWAAGHLAKNQRLATSGPYAYTRNPLYLGTLIVAAGFAVAGRSAGLGLLFAAVFLLVYLPVILLEEQHLRQLFPEYADYAHRVPSLLPWRTGWPGSSRFSRQLYWKNQEYQAALGFLSGVALLAWKCVIKNQS
ncbi:MAG TPA: isoprenylcysteine carboxylmethyltransferase family protein, partial [Bryobacteraceae bacterium]|nr:isoprenylcysteine carboxylmethyltransferase family protein [Bryobacteraceae bacterium]